MSRLTLLDAAAVRVVLIAITKHGAQQTAELARLLPGASVCVADKFAQLMAGLSNPVRAYSGPFRDEIGPLFADFDQLVFFVSLGAVVRLIAPHLKTKDEDPGVVVVDDAGQFVIPVLSGHVGGANAMAEQIAALLGGTAVLTTASDVGKTIAVDILGRELGWKLESPKIKSRASRLPSSTKSRWRWCKRPAARTGGPGPRRCPPAFTSSLALRMSI